MKTIKKPLMVKCKECDWWYNAHYETCPTCASANAERTSLSRRKRKNKERQLKHTIARLYKERDKYKELYYGACEERLGTMRIFSKVVHQRNFLVNLLEKNGLNELLNEYLKEEDE